MDTLNEIREFFAFGNPGNVCRLNTVDDRYPAWAIRDAGGEIFGVLVRYDGDDVNEDFANAKLMSDQLSFSDERENHKYLLLLSSVEKTRNEFAEFCNIFVNPGPEGKTRERILKDPLEWWNQWKTLIGNRIVEKKPYAVLGEMVICNYLLAKGKKVKWGGPDSASHDITAEDTDYEVKSTVSRYDKLVHIAGQFQLQTDRPLRLMFLRFEPVSADGISINDYVEKLTGRGISGTELDRKLAKMGYGKGSSARKELYTLHEVIEYKVDDSFPIITPHSFKADTIPAGITHLSYDVDLTLLHGEGIDVE